MTGLRSDSEHPSKASSSSSKSSTRISKQNLILIGVGLVFLALYVVQLAGYLAAGATSPLWNAAIAVLLLGRGTFGIEKVKKFGVGFGQRFSVGIETERYEPTPTEEAQAIAMSADKVIPEQEHA